MARTLRMQEAPHGRRSDRSDMIGEMNDDPLALFLPPVRAWFRTSLGAPTPVQAQGWPVIAAGKHTLLLAPTGSGKTLAAFLACLDGLWRQPLPVANAHASPPGVQVL